MLTLRAYARHRGTSATSVLRAIARGQLRESLVRVGGVAKIADVARADEEWPLRAPAVEPFAMSLRAYARHRGTSAPSVLRAIARGQLRESLVRVGGVAKIADVARADEEWPLRAPSPTPLFDGPVTRDR